MTLFFFPHFIYLLVKLHSSYKKWMVGHVFTQKKQEIITHPEVHSAFSSLLGLVSSDLGKIILSGIYHTYLQYVLSASQENML